LITDQIGIVCSAFAPRLSDAARHGTDVAAMRAAIQRTGTGLLDGAQFWYNKALDVIWIATPPHKGNGSGDVVPF